MISTKTLEFNAWFPQKKQYCVSIENIITIDYCAINMMLKILYDVDLIYQ